MRCQNRCGHAFRSVAFFVSPEAGRVSRSSLSRTLFYLLIGFGIFILCLVFFKVAERFSRAWLGLWAAFALVLVVSVHHLSRRLVRLLRQRRQPRRVAVVCADAQSEPLSKNFASEGVVVVQVLGLNTGVDAAGIEATVKQQQIQELWISLPLASSALLRDILYRLRDTLVDIRYFPQIDDLGLFRQRIGRLGNNLVIDLTYSPLQGGNAVLKRAEDVILTCALLGILAPLYLLIAVAVKLSSPGPILFRQYRHGADGKPIQIYKFRTMLPHTEPEGQITQATQRSSHHARWAVLAAHQLTSCPSFSMYCRGACRSLVRDPMRWLTTNTTRIWWSPT